MKIILKNWMLVLNRCKEELSNAHAFTDKLVNGVEKINAENTFPRQISVTEVLKEEKVSSYFKCIFAMYKVCCSLQLWIVYNEKSRKKLLGEMDALKKKWKSLGQKLKKYAFDFPRIKMVTYKHVSEDDIVVVINITLKKVIVYVTFPCYQYERTTTKSCMLATCIEAIASIFG